MKEFMKQFVTYDEENDNDDNRHCTPMTQAEQDRKEYSMWGMFGIAHDNEEKEIDKMLLDTEDTMDDEEVMQEPEFSAPFAIANPKTFRKLPVEVQGLKWTGMNVHEMRDFVGKRFADDACEDDETCSCSQSGEWNFLTPVEISGVMESSAIVWDSVQSGWIPVNIGDTILRGVNGEFYPISEDVLNKTYEEVK